MSVSLHVFAILLLILGIISSLVITSYVSKRGTKINVLLFRLYVVKYIHDYYTITKREQGKPGPWFYSFVISMNGALILAILGLILR
jgi:hypothetical protein